MKKSLLIAGALVTAVFSNVGTAEAQHANCDAQARNYANSQTARPSGNVVAGALLGAAAGAIIGGAAGGGKNRVGNGAAIGAGVGALGGAARNNNNWNYYYQASYNDCMARNRPAPRPTYSRGYEPWTPGWYSYCGSRYKTFNPQTGYYHAGGGRYVFCR